MTYNQTLVRKAASIARFLGFSVLVSDAETTESSYLYVGYPSRFGGFEVLGTLRVSWHPKPGWSRGGWLKVREALYFDLRPRSPRYDMERVRKFVARIQERERAQR